MLITLTLGWIECSLFSVSQFQRSCHCLSGKTIVDGQTEYINIAKLFADKYHELYTSVPYESEEMLGIQHEIEDFDSEESDVSRM